MLLVKDVCPKNWTHKQTWGEWAETPRNLVHSHVIPSSHLRTCSVFHWHSFTCCWSPSDWPVPCLSTSVWHVPSASTYVKSSLCDEDEAVVHTECSTKREITDARGQPTCRSRAKSKAEPQELCEQRKEREISPCSFRSCGLNPHNQLEVPCICGIPE